MTYSEYLTRIAILAGIDVTSVNYLTMVPMFIQNSELRICRELDLLVSRARETSTFGSSIDPSLNALLQMPSDFVILRSLGYYTPIATTTTFIPLDERDEGWIRDYWPSRATTGIPKYYCLLSNAQILIAPTPSSAFTVEAAGTTRPAQLAQGADSFISIWLPDLQIAASMVEVCGYLKNFGAQADDPKMSLAWEGRYQAIKGSASTEEGRKKFIEYADKSATSPPYATPTQ